MNTLKCILTTALVGSVTSVAFAGPTADISVTGTIIPGSCSIDIGNGGKFDLGTIRTSSLNADSTTDLSSVTNPINVTCDSPMRFAFGVVDNQADSSAGGKNFGLGVTPNNEKIGSYNVAIMSAVIDGNAPQSIVSSDDGGSTWVGSSYKPIGLIPAGFAGFSDSASTGTGPSAIQNLVGELSVVTPRIVATSTLTLTDDVPLNGSATIELHYL